MRLKLISAAVSAAAIAMAASSGAAIAARPGPATCTGDESTPGLVEPGTYAHGLTITGTCVTVPGADITIDGNLTVAPDASLNAHDMLPGGVSTAANVTVRGNVYVGSGGTLGLGEYFYGPGLYTGPTTVVDGNIWADQPQSLYLSFITVRGNLVSDGGSGSGLNFPLKNITVGGNVVLQGWSGWWIGLFRSTIGGNVLFANNTGTKTGETGALDSSEVASNTIGGNLACYGNSPAAQLGDSGGGPNTVGGRALGECSSLT